MIKQIPILFSTAMVQAILEGRKTMTRRVVKGTALEWLQPDGFTPEFVADRDNGLCPYGKATDKDWHTGMPPEKGYYYVNEEFDGKVVYLQPFEEDDDKGILWSWHEGDDVEDISMDGGPTLDTIKWKRAGDVLWVRENWKVHNWCPDDGEMGIAYMVGDHVQTCYDLPEDMYMRLWEQSVCDLANAGIVPDEETELYSDFDASKLRTRPSIHMPKEAARIWLEVTGVRVERVFDISEAGAIAEGILSYKDEDGRPRYKDYVADASGYGHPDHDYPTVGVAVTSFATLWEKINGRESWLSNPWVWVVEFKVLSTTGKPEGI